MNAYISFLTFRLALLLTIVTCAVWPRDASAGSAEPVAGLGMSSWSSTIDERLLDYYEQDDAAPAADLPLPTMDGWSSASQSLVSAVARGTSNSEPGAVSLPFRVGQLRARVQQAIAIELAACVRSGRLEEAKALRAELMLPRGVSSSEGALLLQSLTPERQADAARILVREAITWQTTRVRQLLDESARSAEKLPALPGRLQERLGEAMTLADLPPALIEAAGGLSSSSAAVDIQKQLASVRAAKWDVVARPLALLRREIEQTLPSLLTPEERSRRERLLLKLIEVIPREYAAGVRDGMVVVPLEYREAAAFTQQARQIHGELTPLWLSDRGGVLAGAAHDLELRLESADTQIAAKQPVAEVEKTLDEAARLLRNQFGISLHRGGTTADIVDEVMLETRARLSESLAAALAGKWADAERLRVEAYTTYDPELEARLMPRDPQLALDIERLLLDGIDEPGVKALLDRRAGDADLIAGYARVTAGLEKATVLLKSGISPTAAALNAGSIVVREGLEGLLVIVAIFAGLRGAENARRRRLFWLGILASLAATALTWILSQTVITSLRAYGEVIAAVTGMLAIVILLLITNWLFHQVYWRQWVSSLKTQAVEGDRTWHLVMAGFLVGYREGFETVLFLQSLMLEAGGKMVGLGVGVGVVLLLVLGFAALWLGLKLPYFKILMVTAFMIGAVLITFVGTTARAAQTVGWLPVHRLMPGSWPAWLGNWMGFYNTWESIGAQVLTATLVLGTWRIARWQAKRKVDRRRSNHNLNVIQSAAVCQQADSAIPLAGCDPSNCQLAGVSALQMTSDVERQSPQEAAVSSIGELAPTSA